MQPAEPWQWGVVVLGVALCYLFLGFGRGWLIRAAQITIFIAVIFSNIMWQWTPNGVLASLVAAGVAYAITAAPVTLLTRLRLRRERLADRRLTTQYPPDEGR